MKVKMRKDLLLGKILAAGEVLRELARAKLNGVSTCEVGAARGQPLLVIQFLHHTSQLRICEMHARFYD